MRICSVSLSAASARTKELKVLSSDKLRYTVYPDGRIYLLNTDYDLPFTVLIRRGEEEKRILLDPLELKSTII
ncbi:MAG: hypothetical protein IKC32_06345 [Clostridia bacterium]|nr:hypothetical protein [Clostridia bacterium]